MAEKGRKTVRKFRPPAVDWSTEDYTGFLNFVDEKDWTCPPVFLDVAEDVLRAGVTEGWSKDVFDLVGYPNNTRCVERAVQSNTYATLAPSRRQSSIGRRCWPSWSTPAERCRSFGRSRTGYLTTTEVLPGHRLQVLSISFIITDQNLSIFLVIGQP